MKNKILSVFLAVLMVMSCFGTLAVTAAGYTDPTIAVECSAIDKATNTFTADIVIYNNPGFSGYRYAVKFDNSKIQIVDVVRDEDDVPESVFPAEAVLSIDEPGTNVAEVSEIVAVASRPKASNKNGALLTIKFKVVSEFEEAVLSIEDEEFEAEDLSSVSFTVVDGSVGLPKITENVTLDGATYVYDGTEKSLAVKGLASGMTVEYSPKTVKTVGTHKITATVKKTGYASLTLTANLEITPKALTLDGVKVDEKTFDNTTAATVNYDGAALVGVVDGDDVSFTRPTATFADANVGTGKAMVMDAIALTGAAAGNYTLTPPDIKGVIVKRVVTIVPDPGQLKKIDTPDPEFTYSVVGDLCGFEISGKLGREGGEDGGEISKKYKFTIGTLETTAGANIELVVAEEYFTILNKDPQTVEVTAPTSAVYGTTDLKVGVVVTVGPKTPAITYTSSNKDVVTVDAEGNITIVGAGNAQITVVVAGDDKYAPYTAVKDIEIKGIPVTVTPTAGQSCEYGVAEPTIEFTASIEGIDFSGSLALEGNKVGAQKVVIGSLSAKNYDITVAVATFEITPKIIVLTGVELWPTKTPAVNMNTDVFNPAIAGILDGDAVTLVTGKVGVEKKGEDYFVTGITLEGADAANYTLNTEVEYTYTNDQDAADFVAQEIGGKADIVDTGPEMTKQALYVQALANIVLPEGVTVEIKDVEADVEGIFDAEGNLVRPEEDTYVVFTFTVEIDGVRSTFKKGITIASSKDNARLLALMYYYYMMNLNKKETVASVQANVADGEVVKGTAVTLTTATAGATIYYTTDGKTPTTASTVYTAPIVINETVTIKAIAVKAGMKNSGVVKFSYKAVDAKTSIALKKDAATIKYFAGYADGTFKPDQVATRYEVIAALNNLFDITTNVAPKALTDVSADMKALVDKFTAAGIIEGFPSGEFKGNEGITREQFATIAVKMMGLDTANAKDAGFKDVSGWSTSYINACVAAGYAVGYPDGTFAPKKNITRAELAQFINNITGAKDGEECSYKDVVEGKWYFGPIAAAAK